MATKEVSIPTVIECALGARTFDHRTLDCSHDDKKALGRLLKPDVDTWRAEFAQQLRSTAAKALADLDASISKIPPAAKAYTLAVLVDKASAMEGRATMAGANVNIQINQFSGQTDKSALLDAITGKSSHTPSFPPSLPQIPS